MIGRMDGGVKVHFSTSAVCTSVPSFEREWGGMQSSNYISMFFLFLKTDYFHLWFLCKSDLRITYVKERLETSDLVST